MVGVEEATQAQRRWGEAGGVYGCPGDGGRGSALMGVLGAKGQRERWPEKRLQEMAEGLRTVRTRDFILPVLVSRQQRLSEGHDLMSSVPGTPQPVICD